MMPQGMEITAHRPLGHCPSVGAGGVSFQMFLSQSGRIIFL